MSHAVRALHGLGATGATQGELAHALAFWAARARPVPGFAVPDGSLEPADALAALPRLPDQSGRIADRVARLVELPTWTSGLRALRPPTTPEQVPAALASLVDAATVRYLRHAPASPVLLVHTATAPNAVLHVLPFLPAELWPESLATVWAAVAAITAGYEPPGEGGDWTHDPAHIADEEVFGRACDHGDEHVLKFTDTALEVFARTHDERAILAAERARTLLSPMGTPA